MTSSNHKLSVLITRPEPGATSLAEAVRGLGLKPLIAPMLEISALKTIDTPKCFAPEEADALIFVSGPAVEFGIRHLQGAKLEEKKIYAVGASTAARIRGSLASQPPVDIFLPEQGFNSEALLGLDDFQPAKVRGLKILIVRGLGGREFLADELRKRGAEVGYLQVYERIPSALSLRAILAEARVSVPSIGVVTSVEGLRRLGEHIKAEKLTPLFEMPILASGARIAREVPILGFTKPPLIADNPTQGFIIAGLKRWAMEKL